MTATARSVSPLARKLAAEFIGTAFLVAGVVGSGIMAQRLTTDPALQLLQNAAATAGVLIALILAFGPASGAHFNPAVTLVDRVFGGIDTRTALAYIPAQILGAITGSIVANLMFSLPAVEWSTHTRTGGNLWLSEGIATLGLLLVIFGVVRSGRGSAAAFAVGAYIGGAYYFTSSTSFANPAVTIGRAFTDTFAGIAPASVPMFVVAQLVGAAVAIPVILLIYPRIGEVADRVILEHDED
ncbi:MAG: aquaporin family protein [Actinobacteria bacterium]|nr:aquaporin family protein [Actinomycetota bacterium]